MIKQFAALTIILSVSSLSASKIEETHQKSAFLFQKTTYAPKVANSTLRVMLQSRPVFASITAASSFNPAPRPLKTLPESGLSKGDVACVIGGGIGGVLGGAWGQTIWNETVKKGSKSGPWGAIIGFAVGAFIVGGMTSIVATRP